MSRWDTTHNKRREKTVDNQIKRNTIIIIIEYKIIIGALFKLYTILYMILGIIEFPKLFSITLQLILDHYTISVLCGYYITTMYNSFENSAKIVVSGFFISSFCTFHKFYNT